MASDVPELRAVGLPDLPEVARGDDLVPLLVAAAERVRCRPLDDDVIVVAQKIVSKAEGRTVRLADVRPSEFARRWAAAHDRDPRVIEVVLEESRRIVRMDRGVLICETSHGFTCANAGVDGSNVADGHVTLLPSNPDASARRLQAGLSLAFDAAVGVIVADTFGRPWREGQVNVALGVAGLSPLADYRDVPDTHGRELRSTAIAVADEIAGAAELVMGKTSRVPAAVVMFRAGPHPAGAAGTGRDLIRPSEKDLFR